MKEEFYIIILSKYTKKTAVSRADVIETVIMKKILNSFYLFVIILRVRRTKNVSTSYINQSPIRIMNFLDTWQIDSESSIDQTKFSHS